MYDNKIIIWEKRYFLGVFNHDLWIGTLDLYDYNKPELTCTYRKFLNDFRKIAKKIEPIIGKKITLIKEDKVYP